jgi:hypothetical protein
MRQVVDVGRPVTAARCECDDALRCQEVLLLPECCVGVISGDNIEKQLRELIDR